MSRLRTQNGKLILFVASVFLVGRGTRQNLLTSKIYLLTLEEVLSHIKASGIQNQSMGHSFEGISELLTVNPIENITNTSHRSTGSPLPKQEITKSKYHSSFFSPCPAKTSGLQNQSLLPKLQFVHIRKTGGTAVVTSFRRAGIDPYRPIPYVYRLNRTALHQVRLAGNRQHIPPRYVESLESIRDKVHLFTIIRNPYDRAISEYYQHFKTGNHLLPPNTYINDANFLNYFIQANFRNGSKDLFIPQYEYIFDTQGNQIVQHILRFESILEDFPRLMECYGLNISLPNEPVNQRQTDAGLSVANLTVGSIAVINEVERKSFEVFGYEMLTSNSTFAPS